MTFHQLGKEQKQYIRGSNSSLRQKIKSIDSIFSTRGFCLRGNIRRLLTYCELEDNLSTFMGKPVMNCVKTHLLTRYKRKRRE